MVARWRGSPDLPRNLSEFIDLTETSRAMRAYLRDLPDSKCEISLQSTWNPFFETKSEVRSRILAELDRRMDEIEALARRTGVTPPKKDDGSHFHWLALAQVRAMTPREVQASCQDAEMATVEAVRAALKELRGLIGLSSPVKRGRPWNGKR